MSISQPLMLVLLLVAPSLSQDIQIVPSEGVVSHQVSEGAKGNVAAGRKFAASHNWQTIEDDHVVPSGLHYRLNMETGKNEAKLLARNDGDRIDIKAATKALKDLGDKGPPPEQDASGRKARAAELNSMQRPVASLKADFDERQLAIMSDWEIIRELLSEYRKDNSTDPRRLTILTDLEYYVHQIDNALSLVEQQGLPILKSALNNSDAQIRQMAAFVIGSASQSNPGVQIAVLDSGILHSLCAVYPVEKEAEVRRKLVYALSAVIRNFPAAQRTFIDLGGPDIFTPSFLGGSASAKEKVKIVTLLLDLVQERQIAEEHGDEGAVRTAAEQHRNNLYKNVDILSRLSGWCSWVSSLLSAPDFDSQEKVLHAMSLLGSQCHFDEAQPLLATLRDHYEASLREEPDEYVQGLLDTLTHVQDTSPLDKEL